MRIRAALAVTVALLTAGVATAGPVSAHAIISLDGVAAVAGKRSAMTLEIQHGCITKQTGTVAVDAAIPKSWGRVVPAPVAGWDVTIERAASGARTLHWVKQGDPQPFGTPVFFPLQIRWPAKPGVYGMTVTQTCPDDVTTWGTPDAPATADAPSPPLTPLPQVQVVANVQTTVR